MEAILKQFPDLSENQILQFQKLQSLYEDWNSKINVISRKDIDELYTRHVLHSLGIAKIIEFRPGSKIMDVGTGGGFPAAHGAPRPHPGDLRGQAPAGPAPRAGGAADRGRRRRRLGRADLLPARGRGPAAAQRPAGRIGRDPAAPGAGCGRGGAGGAGGRRPAAVCQPAGQGVGGGGRDRAESVFDAARCAARIADRNRRDQRGDRAGRRAAGGGDAGEPDADLAGASAGEKLVP